MLSVMLQIAGVSTSLYVLDEKDILSRAMSYLKNVALNKALFSTQKYLYFSYFSTKTYVVGTH